jgi:hypothetical protein
MSYLWYLAGYSEEVEEIPPDPRSVRVRHELMKQVKYSSFKLEPTKSIVKFGVDLGNIYETFLLTPEEKKEIENLPPLKLTRDPPIIPDLKIPDIAIIPDPKISDIAIIPDPKITKTPITNKPKITQLNIKGYDNIKKSYLETVTEYI